MANETTTQTESKPKGSGASDLDSLLNEFSETKPKPADPPAADLSRFVEAVKPVVEYANSKRQEEQNALIKKSVDDAVNFVKDDEGLKSVPNRLVKGFLQDRYAEDQSFKAAYDNRGKDPKSWESALATAKTEFKTDLSALNGNSARTDVDAATAAVRGAARTNSTEGQKIDPASLNDMSDTEFNKYKRNLDAQNRAARR